MHLHLCRIQIKIHAHTQKWTELDRMPEERLPNAVDKEGNIARTRKRWTEAKQAL
jgi:hypothetical protein